MPTAGLTTRREKAGDRCSLCIQAMRALPAAAKCAGNPSSSTGCSSALPAQLAGPITSQLCMSREATLTEATNLRTSTTWTCMAAMRPCRLPASSRKHHCRTQGRIESSQEVSVLLQGVTLSADDGTQPQARLSMKSAGLGDMQSSQHACMILSILFSIFSSRLWGGDVGPHRLLGIIWAGHGVSGNLICLCGCRHDLCSSAASQAWGWLMQL